MILSDAGATATPAIGADRLRCLQALEQKVL